MRMNVVLAGTSLASSTLSPRPSGRRTHQLVGDIQIGGGGGWDYLT